MSNLFSLNAFKVFKAEGFSPRVAARKSGQVMKEIQEDEAAAVVALPPSSAPEPVLPEHPEHPELPRYGKAHNYLVGSRYERSLDITDIAKRIRKEIKTLVANGQLPKGKYSVRTDRYSGGQSLSLKLGAVDPAFKFLNPERVMEEQRRPHDIIPLEHFPRFTPEGTQAMEILEALVASYNYDRSDTQADFFSVNFYANVSLDWDYESAEKTAILTKAS
jgi:hypothetical protein